VEKFRRSFLAHDEEGNEYVIEIYEYWADASTHDNPSGKVKSGKKRLVSNGEHVNRIEQGKYELMNGVILTSEDIDAP
jgi:hypothetical protein